jgi:hypothetical protein
MSKSVSLLTLTKLSTSCCLNNLVKIIRKQTYSNILEWIIIESSSNQEEGICNKIVINELISKNSDLKCKIKYVCYDSNNSNGYLRNKANHLAQGDIIMWLEESDFYFDNRVETCVGKLNITDKMLLGSNNIYVHDLILSKTFRVNLSSQFPNYVIQSGLTYKKEYLTNHKYLENEPNGEVSSFTNNYSEPVEHLILEQSLVQLIHNDNLLNKRQNIIKTLIDNVPGWNKLLDETINIFVPNDYYKLYKKQFISNEYLNYDIVYFTGMHGIIWDPEDMKLGGSEQAVVHLSKHWVKMGKNVIVYGNFTTDKTVDGVVYSRWYNFKFEKKIKNLIVWRTPGIVFLMQLPFKADNIIVDFHDNFSYTLAHLKSSPLLDIFLNKVTKFNFKSIYHLKCYEEFVGYKLPESKFNIIMNGVRVKEFSNNYILNDNKPIVRNPYRFCYCSSYDRGLETILEKMWPIIYQNEPRAELHVYYGMEHIYDMNFKNKLIRLLSQPGVTDHGRQPMEVVANEKYQSTFHLYLNNSVAEIDCISIRESLVTGCIPIISNFGVFAERHGLQFPWDPNNDSHCKLISNDITNKMKDFNFTENARNQLMKSSTIVDWDVIAKTWLNTM